MEVCRPREENGEAAASVMSLSAGANQSMEPGRKSACQYCTLCKTRMKGESKIVRKHTLNDRTHHVNSTFLALSAACFPLLTTRSTRSPNKPSVDVMSAPPATNSTVRTCPGQQNTRCTAYRGSLARALQVAMVVQCSIPSPCGSASRRMRMQPRRLHVRRCSRRSTSRPSIIPLGILTSSISSPTSSHTAVPSCSSKTRKAP